MGFSGWGCGREMAAGDGGGLAVAGFGGCRWEGVGLRCGGLSEAGFTGFWDFQDEVGCAVGRWLRGMGRDVACQKRNLRDLGGRMGLGCGVEVAAVSGLGWWWRVLAGVGGRWVAAWEQGWWWRVLAGVGGRWLRCRDWDGGGGWGRGIHRQASGIRGRHREFVQRTLGWYNRGG